MSRSKITSDEYQAGARVIKVSSERRDRTVTIGGELLYIGIEVVVTAVGRPRLKE